MLIAQPAADATRRWRRASTCWWWTRRSGCGGRRAIRASRVARDRADRGPGPPRAAADARRRSRTTRTGSSACCSCCVPRSFPRTTDFDERLAARHAAAALHQLHAPRATSAGCRRGDDAASRSGWTAARRGRKTRLRARAAANACRARHEGRTACAARWRPARALARGARDPTRRALREQAEAHGRRRDPRLAGCCAGAAVASRPARRRSCSWRTARRSEMLRDRAQPTGAARDRRASTRAALRARRDIEVAQFRGPTGRASSISTECGGEGRNFEFCHRLVLFDLPWNPSSSSSASDGSTASAAACRWRSSTSVRPTASARTRCGCSRRIGAVPRAARGPGAAAGRASRPRCRRPHWHPAACWRRRALRSAGEERARGALAHPRRRVPASCTATATVRRWRRASWRAYRPTWTR